MDILDNRGLVSERDKSGALEVATHEASQLATQIEIINAPGEHGQIEKIVVAGMGGSALAADLARDWLDLPISLHVVKQYYLPQYVDTKTLVIASSFSGNTEETITALADARARGAMIGVISRGGELETIARRDGLTYAQLNFEGQPRMAALLNLRALLQLFIAFGVLGEHVIAELESAGRAVDEKAQSWTADVASADNLAKQLAWHACGKTGVMYAGSRFRSIAYKWKISFNENAKNVAFWNEYSEFNHNEFLGWTSHPVEKPFAVFDLRSSFDPEQIQKRFDLSDRFLSGLRPKAKRVDLLGNTMLEQMVYGSVLADFVSIYLGILNGVDPTQVDLIEKFKRELN